MNKTFVRIWESREYEKYDKKRDDWTICTSFDSPTVVPDCGDYIVISGTPRKIISIKRRVFHEKYDETVLDIIVKLEKNNNEGDND